MELTDGQLHGPREGRAEQTEALEGSKMTLQDTVMVATCHCTFVQIPRMDSPKSEP